MKKKIDEKGKRERKYGVRGASYPINRISLPPSPSLSLSLSLVCDCKSSVSVSLLILVNMYTERTAKKNEETRRERETWGRTRVCGSSYAVCAEQLRLRYEAT
jgi:hypothetical protein